MQQWNLAQMNVGKALYPTDDPRIAEFMSRLDEINALAEKSEGFVWRLKSDSGNATDIKITADPLFLINMSVWKDTEALFDFTYKSDHKQLMAKRREWFARPVEMHMVLWWVKAGHIPTAEEGMARLRHINQFGPSAYAFTFKEQFPEPADEEAQSA